MVTTLRTFGSIRLPMSWVMALAMLPAMAAAEDAKDLTGRWKGAIELPGKPLDFDIDFAEKNGAWTGDISIPAQGAVDLPLAKITIDGDSVAFAMPGVPGDPKFDGKLAEDAQSIAGDFTQSGQKFPFTLARAGNLLATAEESLEGFDAFVEQALKDWDTPGVAIGIVVEDQLVFARGFGLRNIEENLPVTTKTLFAIGSSTKAFTAFVLGTQVDAGKLDWDQPVRELLPEFKLYDEYATNHITPRDLLTHRSGLPRHDLSWYNSSAPREELVRRLRYLQPNEELRAKWQYNNLMFLTAGYLGGRLAGSTWEEAVRKQIFEPLDMRYSNFSVADSQKSSDFAMPYREKDDVIEKMAFRDISQVGPAGSINSNVEDMAKWMMVHLGSGKFAGKRIIEENTLEEMHAPQMPMGTTPEEPELTPPSYGMGWMVTTYRGHYRVAHGGNIDGFSADVTLYPHDRIGIVTLVNKNGAALRGLLPLHAADRLFGQETKDWNGEALKRRAIAKKEGKAAEQRKEEARKADTHPAHPLADYAGEYGHPGYGVIKVTVDGERLAMTYNNITTPFGHWHYEVFSGLDNPDDRTFEDFKIRFLGDMKGDVHAVSAPFEMTLDEIVFTRKASDRMSDPKYLAKFVGKYELAGQTVTIALKGTTLTVSVPGQPLYELEPARDDEFNLKGITGFSVRFVTDDDDKLMARFDQPNGIFEAKRMEE